MTTAKSSMFIFHLAVITKISLYIREAQSTCDHFRFNVTIIFIPVKKGKLVIYIVFVTIALVYRKSNTKGSCKEISIIIFICGIYPVTVKNSSVFICSQPHIQSVSGGIMLTFFCTVICKEAKIYNRVCIDLEKLVSI